MNLHLSPFTSADIARLIGWVPDETALLQWSGPTLTWPLTPDQLERDVASGVNLMFKSVLENEVVGHIEIKAIDRHHSNAMLGRILVAPERRGRGLALPLVREALKVCFDEMKLHRVGLRVFAHNTGAIAAYEKAGFVVEGRERHTKRAPDGTWWDAVTMAILEDGWRAAQTVR